MSLPNKPTNVNCQPIVSRWQSIIVSWPAVAEATGYIVEMSEDNGDYTQLGTSTAQTAISAKLTKDCDTVQFRVKAVNNDGESDYAYSAIADVVYIDVDNKTVQPFNSIIMWNESSFPALPEITEEEQSYIGVDGTTAYESKYQPRLFTISFATKEFAVDRRISVLSDIGKWIDKFKQSARKIRINGKLYNVKAIGSVEIENYPTWFTVTINLKAHYPFGCSSIKAIDKNGTIVNNGERIVYPIITLMSDGAKVSISGEECAVNVTIPENYKVVVDCKNETAERITSGMVENVFSNVSKFPHIKIGENSITITGTAKVEWREEYISL